MDLSKYLSKEALLKALTEAGRVVLIAVVPLAIDMLSNNEFDLRLIAIAGLIAVLRLVDKYIHLIGVELDSEALKKGITRF